MKPIPQNVLTGFYNLLKQRNVPPAFLADYRKWLLYFLDFRAKYPLPDSPSDQVRLFANKLRSKNQTAGQVEQAADAISLYFESHIPKKSDQGNAGMKPIPLSVSPLKGEKVRAPVPDAAIPGQFDGRCDSDRNSASAKTVPQMVCEPPGGKDIPRAKTSNYIPTVLSRKEIDSVLVHLRHPFKLVAQLQYGCGLRISEGCALRVKDFDFDTGLLTIRGKGKKVRSVPLPKTLLPELQAQLERVKKLHDEDLAAGYSGVFLDDQLEKKYPRAAKELIWQWFLPLDF